MGRSLLTPDVLADHPGSSTAAPRWAPLGSWYAEEFGRILVVLKAADRAGPSSKVGLVEMVPALMRPVTDVAVHTCSMAR